MSDPNTPRYSRGYLRDALERLRRIRAIFQVVVNGEVPAAAGNPNWPLDLKNLPLLSLETSRLYGILSY